MEGLLRTLASSLGYLLDETDPGLTQGVLFDVRLELSEPDVIFVPPIDQVNEATFKKLGINYELKISIFQNITNNFFDQITSYVDDIFHMSVLIPRVASHKKHKGIILKIVSTNLIG